MIENPFKFSEFGDEVVAVVRANMLEYGNLQRLLERLNMHAPPYLEDQEELLAEFLYQFGSVFFLHVLRYNLSREQVEASIHRLLEPMPDALLAVPKTKAHATGPAAESSRPGPAVLASIPVQPNPARQGAPMPLAAGRPVAPGAARPPRSAYRVVNSAALARAAEERQPAPPPQVHEAEPAPALAPAISGAPAAPAASAPVDNAPAQPPVSTLGGEAQGAPDRHEPPPPYNGPERRSGVERRSGIDRRRVTETVYKNRRFGGSDRRKSVRRYEDRKKQYGGN